MYGTHAWQPVSSRTPPVDRARAELSAILDERTLTRLPVRYERLGDVLVLPALDVGRDAEAAVAEAYARHTGCRTVLVREGTVTGTLRTPAVRHVWGDEDTETTVTQHGVQFRFDARRIMFSAGNVEERAQMGRIDAAGETVVDLFAGLGYLSLPIAVHGSPERVVGCEINPIAYRYLEANVGLNGVGARYEPVEGDCRDVAPRGVADRVIMGYLHDTHDYLPTAFATLRPAGGVIHFHFKDGVEYWPDDVFERVHAEARNASRTARLAAWRRVKPYAPRVIHGVLDVEVGPA